MEDFIKKIVEGLKQEKEEKEEKGEEVANEKEQKEEKRVEEKAEDTGYRAYIREVEDARVIFLQRYPQLASRVDAIIKIANMLLVEDLKSGNLRGKHFFDYMVLAIPLYKQTVERELKLVESVPEPQEKKEEEYYDMKKYWNDYMELLEAYKHFSQVIQENERGEMKKYGSGKKGIPQMK